MRWDLKYTLSVSKMRDLRASNQAFVIMMPLPKNGPPIQEDNKPSI